MTRLRLLPALLLAAAALPLGAQGIADASVIAAPQWVQYKFTTPGTEKTVSQFAIPIAVIVPFSERFNLDVSTSYANSAVRFNGAQTSSISGLTDTQVRGNFTFGDNFGIVTLGLNLPTGMYKVPTGQIEAAGQIGNDFLLYPVASMGSGLSTTGGVAFAQPVGDWNLGVGASFRHSTAFDAYAMPAGSLRFTPGDEMRLRIGLDRPVLDGSFSVGVTYSKFGKDAADSTTFSTGDRALAQATLSLPVSIGNLSLTAWNLYRAQGQRIGDIEPWENVADVTAAFGWNAGGLYVEPSLEGRVWNMDGSHAGTIGNAGVRLQFNMGALSVNPSLSYAIGKLYQGAFTVPGVVDNSVTDVTGLRGMILFRIR
ncbi:MAG: hypothetical protein HYR75_08550 [Gemmatimonadetes bacterium]|nr:hypothetical protein [Gemmatimonadota bacterium]MBI3569468.1 hypothetical protein [Gemmatimonadota bacterium]